MRLLSLFLLCFFLSTAAHAGVVTKSIAYKDGDVELNGYLAYDETLSSLRPGVVVVPEWWGQNDYIKRRARELAQQGYVAFVADMYGDAKVTTDPKQAEQWATPFYKDRAAMRGRFDAALSVLQSQIQVDKSRIAAIGFCFGGTVALQAARGGADLKGVASFHGGLQFPDKPGAVKAKILVMNGGADPMVPFADRQKFIEDMQTAKADLQFIEYGGALHAFTNPDADAIAKAGLKGVGYNKTAERRSFAQLKSFFEEIFK